MKHHGFTITELVIVIAVLAILVSVLVPKLVDSFSNSKEEIIELYNDQQTVKVYKGDELLYEGSKDAMPDLSEYQLIDVNYINGEIVMKVE